jgi:hypothetical protein
VEKKRRDYDLNYGTIIVLSKGASENHKELQSE